MQSVQCLIDSTVPVLIWPPIKLLSFLMLALVCVQVNAAEFDARSVFGYSPGRDVDAALKRGAKEKKRVLLFTYDPKENFPGLDIQYFMELQESKKLVKENYITVVLERGHKDLQRYPSPGAAEKACYVLIAPDGKTIISGMVAKNGTDGLRIVKEWLALP